jgi:hypothetical protein
VAAASGSLAAAGARPGVLARAGRLMIPAVDGGRREEQNGSGECYGCELIFF